MDKLFIDRRKLLKLGLSASAIAFLPFGCLTLSDSKKDEFLRVISDSELPVNPNQTGEITNFEFNALASLCKYVNKVWKLTSDIDTYLEMLRVDLDLKTSEKPSYLTEYRNAIGLIDLAIDNGSDGDKGWATLLFSEYEDVDFQRTQLGRARRFVFSEIITHFVPISGGFKTFGLWNYTGYFGGPYTAPGSYRKMEIV